MCTRGIKAVEPSLLDGLGEDFRGRQQLQALAKVLRGLRVEGERLKFRSTGAAQRVEGMRGKGSQGKEQSGGAVGWCPG